MKFSFIFRKMASDNLKSLRLKYADRNNLFLEKDILKKEPLSLLKQWLNDALESKECYEPNAVCLSTVGKDGSPSSRFVLLKEVTDAGLKFFTNYGSRKAMEIADNNKVALTLYWVVLHRQVRVEGVATKISHEESEEYFHQRPLLSQIGAVASPQSQRIPNREYLDNIEKDLRDKFKTDETIPIPNWGGYLVTPHTVEFWQGQTNRLHDRIQFRRGRNTEKEIDGKLVYRGDDGWVYERLAP